jgi:hypothetical protein
LLLHGCRWLCRVDAANLRAMREQHGTCCRTRFAYRSLCNFVPFCGAGTRLMDEFVDDWLEDVKND